MRIADAMMKRLEKEVEHVFYLPGGGACYLVDALGQSNIKAVACLHEQGAGYAAVGYAQQRGFGVCLVTSGPGTTNAVTPCLAAYLDSVPVLFISGQVPLPQMRRGSMRCKGTQEAPIIEIVKPITKWAQIIRAEVPAAYWLDYAIFSCRDKRPGPIWLDVPMDVQGTECKGDGTYVPLDAMAAVSPDNPNNPFHYQRGKK